MRLLSVRRSWLCLALLAPLPARAQPTPPPATAPAVSATVQVRPSLRYMQGALGPGDSTAIAQRVVPVTATIALPSGLTIGLRTGHTETRGRATSGNAIEPLSGLTDTDVVVGVARPLGRGGLLATLGATVPTGEAATPEQARTAFLLGQPFHGFRTTGVRQGAALSPGLAFAIPLGADIALGLGASHRIRGSFEPPFGTARYDPGDETLLTVGLDARVDDAVLAVDVTAARFGDDVWGEERYEVGRALAAEASWTGALGETPTRFGVRIRRRTDTSPPVETGRRTGLAATVPSEGHVSAAVRLPLQTRAHVDLDVAGRHYAASRAFGSVTLVEVGIAPGASLNEHLALQGRLSLTAGDLAGAEVAIGIAWTP